MAQVLGVFEAGIQGIWVQDLGFQGIAVVGYWVMGFETQELVI